MAARRFRALGTVLAALALAVLLATARVFVPATGAAAEAWPPAFDARLRAAFRDADATANAPADAPYRLAMAYLLTNFADRQRPEGSKVDQPGAPSRHGAEADAMEGFTRLAPLVAAWLAGGRPQRVTDLRGRSVDLVEWLRRGLVAGTTPASPGYWGPIRDFHQSVVEAADVARALWITRDRLLPILSTAELEQIAAWLHQVGAVQVPDNNWHLFPVLVHEVLASLGLPGAPEAARRHFRRFREFRLGQGWFSDGPDRSAVDWYNAWAIHYELWWIRRISPGFGGDELRDDMAAFADTMPYLIAPSGVPIMGRSVCYRLAAPVPIVAAALDHRDGQRRRVDPGLARRALDAVWRHFMARGAFAEGTITQGYCGPDLRVLDNYSGPSSCLWSLRSLILAFMAGPDDPFWTAPPAPLPVEQASYTRPIPSVGWTIVGDHASGDVRIHRGSASPDADPSADALAPYSLWRRVLSSILWWRPYRPENRFAKYELPVYSSKTPFCGCDVAQLPEDLAAALGTQSASSASPTSR